MEHNTIHTGDCVELSDEIEPGSVDLVLTDPPYGTVKDVAQTDGVDHGMKGKTEWDEALSPTELFEMSGQILRKNGKAILFSQEPYTTALVSNVANTMDFSYRMTWKKDHFANSLIAKNAPVKFTEDVLVFAKKYAGWDDRHNHPLREYFGDLYDYIGETKTQIIDDIGQRADHCFRFDSTQFSICTRETYRALIDRYNINQFSGFREYGELKEIDGEFTPEGKEKYPNTFNLPEGKKYKSDVLEYAKPKGDKHPTQKPVPLLVDLIQTFSNPGDLVVDLTAGSGSTCVAADRTNRRFIGIEKDETYAEIARTRIGEQPENPQLLRDHADQSGLEAYE